MRDVIVYLTLRRHADTIDYYRTRTGREVDFLVTTRAGTRALVQVCADLTDPTIRRRELDALAEAMVECALETGTVITLADEGQVEVEGGRVEIVPGWWWSLRGT